MGLPGEQDVLRIVPGSMKPCVCGATVGDLLIPVPKGPNPTIQGVNDAIFKCKCGRKIPCRVEVNFHREREN